MRLFKLYYSFHFSLRWSILGKNSNFIFTENTNTEVGLEPNILDETICLTSKIIQESKLSPSQDFAEYHDVELANFETEFGMSSTSVPQQSLDLLKQFEVYIIYYINKNNLGTSCCKLVTYKLYSSFLNHEG